MTTVSKWFGFSSKRHRLPSLHVVTDVQYDIPDGDAYSIDDDNMLWVHEDEQCCIEHGEPVSMIEIESVVVFSSEHGAWKSHVDTITSALAISEDDAVYLLSQYVNKDASRTVEAIMQLYLERPMAMMELLKNRSKQITPCPDVPSSSHGMFENVCEVCFENVPFRDMMELRTCKHRYCKNCWRRYLEVRYIT